MMRADTVLGAVLAGGKSSRMGQDKCGLVLESGGETLLASAINLLRRVAGDVVVVGRAHGSAAFVIDDVPGLGPAGAIATVLRHTGRPCLVVPCDAPLLNEQALSLLLRMREARKPETLVTLFRHEPSGRKESLVAVYEPGALAYLEAGIARDLLKLSRLVPENRCAFVPVPLELENVFFNVNTPEELRAVRQGGAKK